MSRTEEPDDVGRSLISKDSNMEDDTIVPNSKGVSPSSGDVQSCEAVKSRRRRDFSTAVSLVG